jgi:hypothetical protein
MSDTMGQPTGSPQEPHGLDTEGPFGSTPATPATPATPSTASPAHRAGSFDQTNTGPDSTRDVASEEARSTVEDAKASGQQVAATAKEQAGQVAGEAKGQAKEVLNQARRELADQASSQHQRAAGGLHSLADELEGMGSGVSTSGVATDLAQQASSKARELARWLESREPGDLLEEARSFARRRPGMFLAGAAVLGLVGGRLTRGAADEARDQSGTADYPSFTDTTAAPVVGTAPVASTPPVSTTTPVTGTGPLTETDPLTGTTPGTTTGTDPLTGTGLGGPTQSSTEGFTR